jgi:hypothetical protein
MLEKFGYQEPFVRFCLDDVIILDSEATNIWNNSDSSQKKIQLITDMMAGMGIIVVTTPIVYDPEDFSPRVRLLVKYENLYTATNAYISVENDRNNEEVFCSILKEIYENTPSLRRRKF